MMDLVKFKAVLKDKGFKATRQRVAVHQAMIELGHASAEQLCAYIRERGLAAISEASVYNTLNWLSKIGIYSQRMSRNNKLYFDVNTRPHIHLYDRVNHNFLEIQDDNAIALLEKYFRGRRWRGYRFEGFDISLICRPSSCKK